MVVVAGAAALTAVGVAAIPSSDGTITACYVTASGVLRVIDTDKGDVCFRGEATLTWSQTGPQGPTGLTGPQGTKGDTGPRFNGGSLNVIKVGTLH